MRNLDTTDDMEGAARPMVEMIGVHKWFGDFQVLKNINLTVRK